MATSSKRGTRSVPVRRVRRPNRDVADGSESPRPFSDLAKTVYVFGAGASAPAASSPVVTSNLLRLALEKPPRRTPTGVLTAVRRLLEVFGDFRTPPTIDDVLDVLEYAVHRRMSLSPCHTVTKLVDARASLLRLTYDFIHEQLHYLTGGENPYSALVSRWSGSTPLAVVTLNWDCLLEKAFLGYHKTSSPTSIDYGVPFATYDGPIQKADLGALTVLKPHGSLSWAYCAFCGYSVSFIGTLLEPTNGEWMCSQCNRHTLEPVLIPPMSVRDSHHPLMTNVWSRVEAAVRICRRLVFVGYSLPSQDVDVRVHLMRALAQRGESTLSVEVVNLARNREARTLERTRYLSFFNKRGARFSWHHEGFHSWLEGVAR